MPAEPRFTITGLVASAAGPGEVAGACASQNVERTANPSNICANQRFIALAPY